MGVRGDSEPGNSIDTYRPCTKGYRKTTELAKGSGATKYLGIGPGAGNRGSAGVGDDTRYLRIEVCRRLAGNLDGTSRVQRVPRYT